MAWPRVGGEDLHMLSVATNMYMSRAADKGRSPKSGRFGRGFEVLTKRNDFKTACYEALPKTSE
jgi:hypothetical protein